MQGVAHCRISPADAHPARKRQRFVRGSVIHEIFNKNYPPAKRMKTEAKEDPEDEKEEFEGVKEELEQVLVSMEEKLEQKLGAQLERMVELEVEKKLAKMFEKELETLKTLETLKMLEKLEETLGKKVEKAFGNQFQKQMQEKRPRGSIALEAVVSDRVPSADTRSCEHVLEACLKLLAEQDGQ